MYFEVPHSLFIHLLLGTHIDCFPELFVKAHMFGNEILAGQRLAIFPGLLRTPYPCKGQISCRVTTVEGYIATQAFPDTVIHGWLFV